MKISAAALPLAILLAAACQATPSGPPADGTAGGEAAAAIAGKVRVRRDLVFRPSPSPGTEAPSPEPSGAEIPVAGAEVFCADAGGMRIPGIPKAVTNADGAYRLRGVPLGYAYVVMAVYPDAAGRQLRLRTLARLVDRDQDAPIDTATSLVARAALGAHAGLVAGFDPEIWKRAVASAQRGLDQAALPDPGDLARLDAEIARLTAADAGLAADVTTLRATLLPVAAPR